MKQPSDEATVTREEALRHIRAVEMLHRGGAKIADPVEYFNEQIARISERLERERKLDPEGEEMIRIKDWMTTEEYFRWLEGVLAYQTAYRNALVS